MNVETGGVWRPPVAGDRLSTVSAVYADLKSVSYWVDDIGSYEGSTHFGIAAQVFVGLAGQDPADSFDVLACSPSWVAWAEAHGSWEVLEGAALEGMPSGVAPGAGIWLLRRWSRLDFENAVRMVIEQANPGPDWGTLASRISRLLPWEYDYRYDEQVNRDHGLPDA